jgi:hypothetical protein
MRQILRDAFAQDVAQLSHLVGRDLSHWLDGSAPRK